MRIVDSPQFELCKDAAFDHVKASTLRERTGDRVRIQVSDFVMRNEAIREKGVDIERCVALIVARTAKATRREDLTSGSAKEAFRKSSSYAQMVAASEDGWRSEAKDVRDVLETLLENFKLCALLLKAKKEDEKELNEKAQ